MVNQHGRLENVPFEDAFQGKTEIFQPAMLVYGSVDGGSMDFSPKKHGDVWEDKQNPQKNILILRAWKLD